MVLYSDWCRFKFSHPFQKTDRPLPKAALDILRFLAENGAHTAYDLAEKEVESRTYRGRGRKEHKGLGYSYPYVHRNAEFLQNEGLVEAVESTEGGRLKKSLNLTFNGLIIFLSAWKDVSEEMMGSIKRSLVQQSALLPLISKYWTEIVRIIGEEQACTALVATASKEGRFVKIGVRFEDETIENELFVPFEGPVILSKQVQMNEIWFRFIAEHRDLYETYKTYYAYLQNLVAKIHFGVVDDVITRMKYFLRDLDHEPTEAVDIIKGALEPVEVKMEEEFPLYAEDLWSEEVELLSSGRPDRIFSALFIEELLWKTAKEKPWTLLPIEGTFTPEPWMVVSFSERRI